MSRPRGARPRRARLRGARPRGHALGGHAHALGGARLRRARPGDHTLGGHAIGGHALGGLTFFVGAEKRLSGVILARITPDNFFVFGDGKKLSLVSTRRNKG